MDTWSSGNREAVAQAMRGGRLCPRCDPHSAHVELRSDKSEIDIFGRLDRFHGCRSRHSGLDHSDYRFVRQHAALFCADITSVARIKAKYLDIYAPSDRIFGCCGIISLKPVECKRRTVGSRAQPEDHLAGLNLPAAVDPPSLSPGMPPPCGRTRPDPAAPIA